MDGLNRFRKERRPRSREAAGWRRTAAAVLAVSTVLSGGCGELTAGGLAETQVQLSGDAEDSSTSAPSSTAGPSATSGEVARPAGAQEAEGDVAVTAEVSIRSVDGAWIPLTGGLRDATVDIAGSTEATLGSESVDPGLYTAVRARFTSVEADVEAGLPLLGTITVDLGDGNESVTVEEAVNLELEAEAKAELLVDLNSPVWLETAVPLLDGGTVSVTDFASAVELRVR